MDHCSSVGSRYAPAGTRHDPGPTRRTTWLLEPDRISGDSGETLAGRDRSSPRHVRRGRSEARESLSPPRPGETQAGAQGSRRCGAGGGLPGPAITDLGGKPRGFGRSRVAAGSQGSQAKNSEHGALDTREWGFTGGNFLPT